MITESPLIKKIENNSGYSTIELVSIVADKLAEYLLKILKKQDKILIICGIGNNGADGLALASLLNKYYQTKVYLIADELKTEAANHYYSKLDKNMIIDHISNDYDIIIDCIYGFSFHGSIKAEQRSLFNTINNLDGYKISIDINSGCEADSAICDSYAIKSNLTLALAYLKPFHLFQKEHMMFKELAIIELPLSTNEKSNYFEMDEERFINQYPFIPENGYKGINGKSFIIAGSYGMAGACGLNIIGALSAGASYLHCAIDESIYPILANRFLNVVFHPMNQHNFNQIIHDTIYNVDSILFGSGINNLNYQNELLESLLQNSKKTIILDANALRLLKDKLYIIKLSKPKLILTPHIKEFADMINKPLEIVKQNKIELAKQFAKEYHCILILKDCVTIVANGSNEIYVNNQGNNALAKAGSGDLLAGIVAHMAAIVKDNFEASMMAVWFYNKICQDITQDHSKTLFDHELYLTYADKFFKKYQK